MKVVAGDGRRWPEVVAGGGGRRAELINNSLEPSRVCLSSSLFVVAVRLRCFAVGVEIARIASSALFDFTPSTTFPSCRIGSYDILIGSNNGSSLAVKGWLDVRKMALELKGMQLKH
ncbi:hypothetical protein M5K25_015757 [Dendrobium thyrsiflorum]|uniref:Uncharacterized protein n=1 Tax=Dendrobium thyrsiflorum TaxID=117978 RepID=A0ABD0URW1_DENTH